MATKKELEEFIIRLDESVNSDGGMKDDIKGINKHLGKLNGSIESTNIKLAKTDVIAISADKKGDNNRHYIDRLTIAVIAAIITAGGSVVAVILL